MAAREPEMPGKGRNFVFRPTPAVAQSRRRTLYLNCTVCRADNSEYLFHKVGVRFVQCKNCGIVYINPVGTARQNYFDIEVSGQYRTAQDKALCIRGFETFVARVAEEYERVEGAPLRRTVLLGRYFSEFAESNAAQSAGLSIVTVDDDQFNALALDSNIDALRPALNADTEVVILNEFLEACSDPASVVEKLRQALPASTWFVVTYSHAGSMPARMMRRYWPQFFDVKTTFFDTSNLAALMLRFDLRLKTQFSFPVSHSLGYVLDRVAPDAALTHLVDASPARKISMPLRTGHHVAIFREKHLPTDVEEKLSIVFPVYNEAKYVAQVIDALLAKELKIPKELIIVESKSTDGTREIVERYANEPGVKLLLEERPRGKGHAVRTGLDAVTGTIILIQDADFEYDLDDYDALLEPILQHKTSFVLGSRSLGLDDWKVRRFARGAAKGLALNVAQLIFARTFNFLYQQSITDVNTMFKIFRTECLEGIKLESDRFDLDIELACKLVKNGYAPIEVPVNYVARGFDEGKKISFLRDAFPSYAAFFRYRFE
jgi:hypothetical protein